MVPVHCPHQLRPEWTARRLHFSLSGHCLCAWRPLLLPVLPVCLESCGARDSGVKQCARPACCLGRVSSEQCADAGNACYSSLLDQRCMLARRQRVHDLGACCMLRGERAVPCKYVTKSGAPSHTPPYSTRLCASRPLQTSVQAPREGRRPSCRAVRSYAAGGDSQRQTMAKLTKQMSLMMP